MKNSQRLAKCSCCLQNQIKAELDLIKVSSCTFLYPCMWQRYKHTILEATVSPETKHLSQLHDQYQIIMLEACMGRNFKNSCNSPKPTEHQSQACTRYPIVTEVLVSLYTSYVSIRTDYHVALVTFKQRDALVLLTSRGKLQLLNINEHLTQIKLDVLSTLHAKYVRFEKG